MQSNKRGNISVIIIVLVISVMLVGVISWLLLKDDEVINQGSFRINDLVVTSTVDAEDKTTDLNNWELNLSQKNNISILVDNEGSNKISNMSIDNIKIEKPSKHGKIIASPKDEKQVFDILDSVEDRFYLYMKEKDGAYIAEIDIDNKDFLTGYKVPSDVKEIRYDGTLLQRVSIKPEELKFKISFNLNIIDIQGKISTAKIELEMPNANIINDGKVVEKIDPKKFAFKISK